MTSRMGGGLAAAALALALGTGLALSPTLVPPAEARQAIDLSDLAERVIGAVVNISTSTRVDTAGGARPGTPPGRGGPPGTPPGARPGPGAPFDELFEEFFRRRGENPPGSPGGPPGQQTPQRRQSSLGSGFVIDPAGIIITNNHVIDNADEITVIFNDGTRLRAELVGRDRETDVAVLRVQSPRPLTHVPMADSDKIRIGEPVMAIGNPLGLGGTVTAGIVSARGRNIGAGPYTDYLQIDAPINRGNSGGPTFNLAGEVIGVNSAIYTPTGGSVGIGFAVPASTVTKIVAQLRAHGSVSRGWLGVQIQPVDQETADAVGLSDAKGALVSMVTPGSPAESAGFKQGDIVLKANGQDIADNRVLARFVAELTAGQTATFEVWRDSAAQTLTATIAARDEDKIRAQLGDGSGDPVNPEAAEALPGVQLSAITEEIRQAMNVPAGTEGLVVTKVEGGSDAATKGLSQGDIVVAIGNQPVKSVADVTKAVSDAKAQNRKSVLILVEENGVRRYLALSVG